MQIQGASARALLVFGGTTTNIAANTTTYAGLGAVNASLGNVAGIIIPFACTLANFYGRATGSVGGAAESWIVTLQLDGADTPLTFTLPGSAGAAIYSASDLVHQVAAAAGQYVNVKIVSSASATGRPGAFTCGMF